MVPETTTAEGTALNKWPRIISAKKWSHEELVRKLLDDCFENFPIHINRIRVATVLFNVYLATKEGSAGIYVIFSEFGQPFCDAMKCAGMK